MKILFHINLYESYVAELEFKLMTPAVKHAAWKSPSQWEKTDRSTSGKREKEEEEDGKMHKTVQKLKKYNKKLPISMDQNVKDGHTDEWM